RVVDRSIDATTAASTGIAEYQYDMSGEYSYFEQTPSWQRFQTESDSIGTDYDGAVSSWNAALGALQKRLGALDKLPSLPVDHAL
ncbi:MAG: hypothetical protein JWN72_551, partial [Thermoleophilia bacterium]|nr:hypothetical protein [Thermoleophilia bacterium]